MTRPGLAAVLVALLTACGSTGEAPSPDAGAPDAAAGCSRPRGAGRGVACTDDDGCLCGLSCLEDPGATSGVCMQPCATAGDCSGQTPLCGLSAEEEIKRDAEEPYSSANVCLGELARFGPCLGDTRSRCGDGLACLPSVFEDTNEDGVQDAYHCQLACDFGTNTCPVGEDCVANNGGVFVFEEAVPGDPSTRKTCAPGDCEGTGSCPCDQAHGFRWCGDFEDPSGAPVFYCSKPRGMCGRAAAIAPAQVLAGATSIPEAYVCDATRGLGCDLTLGGVAHPAAVACQTGDWRLAGEQGVCTATCGFPDDSGDYRWLDCPAGMACLTAPVFYSYILSENGAEKLCQDDGDCASVPGATCGTFTQGRRCTIPYGVCGTLPEAHDAGVSDAAGVDADAGASLDAAADAGSADARAADAAPSDAAETRDAGDTAARGATCAGSAECLPGLTCEPSVPQDDDGDGYSDLFTCQARCDFGASSCAGGEVCLADDAGYFELELRLPGDVSSAVACRVADCPGASCPCDAAHGYRWCGSFASGTFCARPTGVCGQAASTLPISMIFGAGPIPSAYVCDARLGTACDVTLGGVANPAEVTCESDNWHLAGLGLAPLQGVCLATCGFAGDDGSYVYKDCPAGMSCVTSPAFNFHIPRVNGLFTACSTAADCAAFPGADCVDFGGPKWCAHAQGMCD